MDSEKQLASVIPNFCSDQSLDEETNNGPLDFSLHRAQESDPQLDNIKMEMVPLEETVLTESFKKTKNQRVKLTLRENSDQREKRLKDGRDRMRRLRASETIDDREVRLQKARDCQDRRRQRERMLESPEERERRLCVARERTRLRRAQESPDQRELRLKATRERLRLRRACETLDERQKRLQRLKDRKVERESVDKDFGSTSSRRRRKLKLDDGLERRQTRGISIKYDTFEDDLDEALFNLHSTDMTWVTEPEVCLSVDSSQNAEPTPQLRSETPSNFHVPHPQDLHNQIAQHVTNLVSNSDVLPSGEKDEQTSVSDNTHVQDVSKGYFEEVPCQKNPQHANAGSVNSSPDYTSDKNKSSQNQDNYIHPYSTNKSSGPVNYSPRSPLNLHQSSCIYPRYDPPPYEESRRTSSAYTTSYHVHSQAPLEEASDESNTADVSRQGSEKCE